MLVAVGSVAYETGVLAVDSHHDISVVRRCVDVADLIATAATQHVEVVVVSLALRGLDADLVDRVAEEGAAVIGIAASQTESSELAQIGIRHVVDATGLGQLPSLIRTVAAATAAPVGQHASSRSDLREAATTGAGRVIAVWGATGAPGRSTVAVGLAAALASDGLVMLVDADVYGGALAAMLGVLDESSGLLAAARSANGGRLESASLGQHARTVADGLEVLTGLPRADRWIEVKPVLVRSILRVARERSEHVVVDCGFNLEFDEEISYDTTAPRRNGATLAIIEQADEVVVVGRADPVGLARLIRALSELDTIAPAVIPRVVINRVRPSLGWSQHDIVDAVTRATGVLDVTVLPDDQAACDQAGLHGQTLEERAPDSKLAKALRTLAGSLRKDPSAAAS